MRTTRRPTRRCTTAMALVAGGVALAVGSALAAPKPPPADTAPPTVVLSFPSAGGVYRASTWIAGCTPTGLCGTATDQSGVTSVEVAVFRSGTPTFVPATLGSPGATTTSWRLAYPLPADGTYSVRIRATDVRGNTTPAAAQATVGFRIDTAPPPAPVLEEKPDNPTSDKNAHFRLTSVEAGATFECRLDAAPFAGCGDVLNYNNLSVDEHCLAARAVDAAGNLSPQTAYCWSIILKGGFPISGTVDSLAPGVTRPLNLLLGNPYNFAIRVTAVDIAVRADTGNEGCDGPTNLRVTRPFSVPVTVPANSTRSLDQLGVAPADRPQLTMPNLAVDQDACKGATFSLAFSGQAVKP